MSDTSPVGKGFSLKSSLRASIANSQGPCKPHGLKQYKDWRP